MDKDGYLEDLAKGIVAHLDVIPDTGFLEWISGEFQIVVTPFMVAMRRRQA